mgnify:CR=1 FL=1
MNKKVFISGSIAIKQLAPIVLNSLVNIQNSELQVLIGDAEGVDTAVQKYLKANGYYNVVVYSIFDEPRYIASDDFMFKKIIVDKDIKCNRLMQTQKDIAMTNDSAYSFVLWDGKSKGSHANILRSIEQNKGVKVYLNQIEDFLPPSKINTNEINYIYYDNNGYTAQEIIQYINEEKGMNFKNTREFNKFLIDKKIIEKREDAYIPLTNHDLFIIERYRGKVKGIKFTNAFIDWFKINLQDTHSDFDVNQPMLF